MEYVHGGEAPHLISKAKPMAAKVPASLARDARVENVTASRDLALFLRSTGPPKGSPKATTSYPTMRSSSKASKIIGSGSSTRSSPSTGVQPSSPTLSVPSIMTLQRIDTRLSMPQSNNKKRFIAREASGSTGDSTSALADFFRTTLPPVEGEDFVPHRISRSVAPFRTTMDSVQFDMASETTQKAVRESATESGSIATDSYSYQSSMTSSTGLLSSAMKRNEELTPAVLYSQRRTPMCDGLVRTQRRVRDPYAIGDDDLDMEDDMDLVIPAPSKPAWQEESLAEFLRNVTPPPPNYPKYEEGNTNKKVPKKSSAVNLMTRLSRGPSRKDSISSPVFFEKPQTHSRPLQPIQRPDTFDGTRPCTQSQTQLTREAIGARLKLNITEASYRPVDLNPTHSAVGLNGASQRQQRTRPKPVGEPRGARVAQSSGMDELAAFLRDSAPPSMGRASERGVESREKGKEENSGMNKLRSMAFRSKGKRKEVAGIV